MCLVAARQADRVLLRTGTVDLEAVGPAGSETKPRAAHLAWSCRRQTFNPARQPSERPWLQQTTESEQRGRARLGSPHKDIKREVLENGKGSLKWLKGTKQNKQENETSSLEHKDVNKRCCSMDSFGGFFFFNSQEILLSLSSPLTS